MGQFYIGDPGQFYIGANTVSGRRHRPPPLTKIEQRRAAAITFDDSPRAILAAAWAGASDRDRRDLVNRVTGRDAA